MKIKLFALILALVTPTTLLAQTAPGTEQDAWTQVQAISPGEELLVELRSQKRVKGQMRTVTATTLTLARGQKTTDLNRSEVLKVFRLIPKSSKKATLIGLAIGAGIGGSYVSGGGESGESYPIVLFGGVGVGLGALAGYLVGRGKRQELLYESK